MPINKANLRDGEPCSHVGCLSHISHPCEGCGRVGGIRSDEYYRGRYGWFDNYWADKITPKFAAWWLDHYGHPDKYEAQDDSDYFIRMAFAFQGWIARFPDDIL